MKNNISDLNDHLFAQIERLGDEGLSSDELRLEIERTKAITNVASQIVQNGRLALDAQIAASDMIVPEDLPKMLRNKE